MAALLALLVVLGVLVGVSPPAVAASNTWFNGKAQSQQWLYEPTVSRSFSRTGVTASVAASGNLFRMTVYLGNFYTTGPGQASINSSLSTAATKARWVHTPYPSEQGRLTTKVTITGIPGGGMRIAQDPKALTEEAERLEPMPHTGSVLEIEGLDVTFLGQSEAVKYWTYAHSDGTQVLIADYGAFISSVSTSADAFLAEGLQMVANDGTGGPDQSTLLLPPGFDLTANRGSAPFESIAPNLFVASGASDESIEATDASGTVLDIDALMPVTDQE
ncbi:hypothetical protein [Aeromicrobium sp. Leaf350]|uniref:hypothetical protein n=1 Tax=Aeromicrobium sp. Leaf350 TaxID=2876565 RepID=UPI001E30E8C6|nr:hypothetical protein [Aeromicrobium sp. Leaf350]